MPTEQQTKPTDRVAVAEGDDPIPPAGPEADVEASEPPAWFRTKRQTTETPADDAPTASAGTPKLLQPAKRPKRRQLIVERPDDERSAFSRFVKFAATGYGFSLILHTIVLIVLGFQYIDFVTSGIPGAAELGFTEDDGEALDFGEDDSLLQEAGGEDAAIEELQPVAVLEPTPEDGDPILEEIPEPGDAAENPTEGTAENGMNEGAGQDAVDSAPGGRKFGDNTITKGSFTIRVTSTDNRKPDQAPGENFDPGLNESYFIYIYVELDADEELNVQDIEGSIVEKRNDNLKPWHTLIPFHPEKRYDRNGGSLEGTDTSFYSPRSRSNFDPFVLISERHWKRNSPIPVSTRKIGGKEQKYAVIRVFVPGSMKLGIRDQITIECKPLNEKQEFEIVF